MAAPNPPVPPGLGRQGEGLPGDVPFYGQVQGTSLLPTGSAPARQVNGWFPPMAGGWDPMTDAKRWHPPLRTDVSLRPEAELEAGRAELELMNEVYGNVMDAKKKAYAQRGNHGKVYDVERYLGDRDSFFGSTQAYLDYAAIAQKELDADGARLRNMLDPSMSVRGHRKRWKEAQVCFYAWTRRAFEKKLGSDEQIVGMIRAGSSPTLRAALKQVRSDYAQKFGTQEANARPIKSDGSYRLGTLSDHAMGNAVDIEPSTNAQITPRRWQAILAYTGKTLSTSTRASKWKGDPQGLHSDIKAINDEFVRLLKAAVDAKAAAGVDGKKVLAEVMKDDKHLGVLGETFLRNWQNGFFSLPWALVKELHEEKLVWGATFDEVDLHHFQVP